ncbi:hypothetical protein [Fibrella aquatilis]|uniref:Uncharacterized protein n=1 Tax=Fibrella aquatilis TaxID=2817059 RepID=A0A939G9R5_9BACT|nr:hypothetical protein [Fibrella aquatilis]MBO0933605.1 hypothetical protein [Fibrella aquatilis]
MTYADYALLDLNRQFGLTDVVESLFPVLPSVEPGDLLTTQHSGNST